jgi:hypothetical protein
VAGSAWYNEKNSGFGYMNKLSTFFLLAFILSLLAPSASAGNTEWQAGRKGWLLVKSSWSTSGRFDYGGGNTNEFSCDFRQDFEVEFVLEEREPDEAPHNEQAEEEEEVPPPLKTVTVRMLGMKAGDIYIDSYAGSAASFDEEKEEYVRGPLFPVGYDPDGWIKVSGLFENGVYGEENTLRVTCAAHNVCLSNPGLTDTIIRPFASFTFLVKSADLFGTGYAEHVETASHESDGAVAGTRLAWKKIARFHFFIKEWCRNAGFVEERDYEYADTGKFDGWYDRETKQINVNNSLRLAPRFVVNAVVARETVHRQYDRAGWVKGKVLSFEEVYGAVKTHIDYFKNCKPQEMPEGVAGPLVEPYDGMTRGESGKTRSRRDIYLDLALKYGYRLREGFAVTPAAHVEAGVYSYLRGAAEDAAGAGEYKKCEFTPYGVSFDVPAPWPGTKAQTLIYDDLYAGGTETAFLGPRDSTSGYGCSALVFAVIPRKGRTLDAYTRDVIRSRSPKGAVILSDEPTEVSSMKAREIVLTHETNRPAMALEKTTVTAKTIFAIAEGKDYFYDVLYVSSGDDFDAYLPAYRKAKETLLTGDPP